MGIINTLEVNLNNMDPINQTSGGSNKTLYIVIGILVVLLIGGYLYMRGNSNVKGNMYGVDVDRNLDGSTTYESGYGKVTTSQNKLPSDWPSDVPTYRNAQISQSGSVDTQIVGTEATSMVILNSPDNSQIVSDFYKAELVSKGWTINAGMSREGNVFAVKENRMVSVGISSLKTGGSMITMSTGIIPESLKKSLDAISAAQKANPQNKIPQ